MLPASACPSPLPCPRCPRAHRDLGLQHLVARALRVVVGIDEAGEPRLLIGLQNLAAVPAPTTSTSPRGDQDRACRRLMPPRNSPAISTGV